MRRSCFGGSWKSPPPGSSEILEQHLNGKEPLIAPELLNCEVGNVLVTKVRLIADDVSELFGNFLDLRIETYSLGADEYRGSHDLAHCYRLTVYEASDLGLVSARRGRTRDKVRRILDA